MAKIVVIAFVALSAVAFAFAYVVVGSHVGWQRFEPNACIAMERCFCEAARPGFVAQPANAISNVAFVVVAFLIAWDVDRARRTLRDASFALLVAFLGVGSFALHATLTKMGGKLDVASMIVFAAFLVADAYAREKIGRAFVVVAAVALVAYALAPDFGTPIFGVLVVTYAARAVVEARTSTRRVRRWLVRAAVSFALALAFWLPSHTHRPLCEPTSLLQGHAAWHVLCAVAAYCVYRARTATHAFFS